MAVDHRVRTSATYGAPGLKLSLGYFHIDFRDRIITPPFRSNLLLQQNVYGSLIGTLADDAAAAAFLQSEVARGATYVDLVGTRSSGVRYTYSIQEVNAARVLEVGFDLSTQYSADLGSNRIQMNAALAMIREISTSFSATASSTDLVNTYGNPLKYRAGARRHNLVAERLANDRQRELQRQVPRYHRRSK
jgi:hypothetical protein